MKPTAPFVVTMALLLATALAGAAPERADIIGAWHVVGTAKMADGVVYKVNERVIYKPTGAFFSEGSVTFSTDGGKTRLVTISGWDSGTWTYDGARLTTVTKAHAIDFFSSAISEVTRADLEAEIAATIDEPTVLVYFDTGENSLLFLNRDDGVEYRMTPLADAPSGSAPLVEVLATFSIDALGGDPTAIDDGKPDVAGERIRRLSREILEVDGFEAAPNLPTFAKRAGIGKSLRPTDDIVERMLCLYAAISWVVAPEADMSSERIQSFIEHYKLGDALTEHEQAILGTRRNTAQTQYRDSIGWQMENLWALAWVLGFDEAIDVDQGQMTTPTMRALWAFIDPAWTGKKALAETVIVRPLSEVAQMEDLFYCAHNAVRSAQSGKPQAVPPGYHPILHGGVVAEKRHALTWVLSPGVAWEDTDLST